MLLHGLIIIRFVFATSVVRVHEVGGVKYGSAEDPLTETVVAAGLKRWQLCSEKHENRITTAPNFGHDVCPFDGDRRLA